MAHAAGDAHEFVIYGAHFRVSFPLLDADGDLVTGATTPDSEVSQDAGTFADASNEMTELATSSGMYYLDLIGTETDCKQLAVICKSATAGMKTTPITLYPNRLPILESGVAEAGAAGTITLAVASASAKDDFYNGCYVHITDNDAAGSQYQVRKIIDYVGSTRVCTIDSNWGTNPSSSSNYDILVPPGMAVVQWAGGKIADPTVAGVPEADVTHWIGTAAATPTVAGVPEVDVTHFNGTAGTFASGRPEVNTSHFGGTAGTFASGRPEVNTTHLGGVAQSLTDLKDFADTGYDPATHKVEGVKTVDALTTNNDKTGYRLSAAGVDDIWDEDIVAAHGAADTAGRALRTLDAISDRTNNSNLNALLGVADSAGVTITTKLDTIDDFLDSEIADIQARLPAALVGGRMDSSIGAMAANVLTAAATAADFGAEVADAVWDEALAGHLGAGSTGAALNAAGAAGDPWSTALPGAYGAGTAGKIVGDNVDAKISLVKAKTDNLPASPAATGDAMTLTAGERNSVATALLDLANGVETSVTVRQALRGIAATLAGDVTGGPAHPIFKSIGGSTARVDSTADADGNRTVALSL